MTEYTERTLELQVLADTERLPSRRKRLLKLISSPTLFAVLLASGCHEEEQAQKQVAEECDKKEDTPVVQVAPRPLDDFAKQEDHEMIDSGLRSDCVPENLPGFLRRWQRQAGQTAEKIRLQASVQVFKGILPESAAESLLMGKKLDNVDTDELERIHWVLNINQGFRNYLIELVAAEEMDIKEAKKYVRMIESVLKRKSKKKGFTHRDFDPIEKKVDLKTLDFKVRKLKEKKEGNWLTSEGEVFLRELIQEDPELALQFIGHIEYEFDRKYNDACWSFERARDAANNHAFSGINDKRRSDELKQTEPDWTSPKEVMDRVNYGQWGPQ